MNLHTNLKQCLSSVCLFSLTLLFSPLAATETTSSLKIMTPEINYAAVVNAYEKQDWKGVVHYGSNLITNFYKSPESLQTFFYVGEAYFHLGSYDLSNKNLSRYLKSQSFLKYFTQALQMKYEIAEKFRLGAKRHVAGLSSLPQWIPAYDDAAGIYDEIISAVPTHELAAKSLFAKASLELEDGEFKKSVETYQNLIFRFPKHELSSQAHVQIGNVYLKEACAEYPDADFLDLAKINLEKFEANFPAHKDIALAKSVIQKMEEVYAKNFYETAQFFERTKKPQASVIYYAKIINTYPSSTFSNLAKGRLKTLQARGVTQFPELIDSQISSAPSQEKRDQNLEKLR